ncbi:MAG TPA: LLM class flavin-dependent oxidoreductase [Ktedonobacterales bacterium]|nr:LLM class flavin-dependent oxidoreductase [Ktedonobacterales bacterium]
MLLGQQLASYSPSTHGNHWDTTLAAARACEQAGLDSVWLADHFMFPDDKHPEKEVPVFDCFVVLGAIAACTSSIRIGELVVGVPYRNPVLLAKMLTTLDVIAHGRTIVGLGAAWHEPEFRAYGWPFPSVRDRMEMLEEAVQIVDLVMTERPASFSGKHYTVDGAYNDPMPVLKPTHHDRWQWREGHPAAGGAVRGFLQRRRQSGRRPPQIRRAAPALRACRQVARCGDPVE